MADRTELRAWQVDALAAWSSNGHQGVVEAVTGAGKTRVGLEAIARTLEGGKGAYVLVPTIDLQRQWIDRLREFVPPGRIGRLGGGGSSTMADKQLVVAVNNSAHQASPGPETELIVADEVHRCGSPSFSRALFPCIPKRLGLTATFERSDEGVEKVLEPYFGSTIFSVDYRRALADEVIAPFRIATLGVQLTEAEQREYDAASKRFGEAWSALRRRYGRDDPFGWFIEKIANAAKEGGGARREKADARQFLSAMSELRRIVDAAEGKRTAVAALAEAFRSSDRAIVFTDRKATAGEHASILAEEGLAAEAMDSGMTSRQRRDALARFEAGEIAILTAPHVLDEGIDVPAADLGVVVTTSRSRRQLIQRMGRVLRPKADGRPARVVFMYVDRGRRDRFGGGIERFLDEISSYALAVQDFRLRSRNEIDRLVKYLDPTAPVPPAAQQSPTQTESFAAQPAPPRLSLGTAPNSAGPANRKKNSARRRERVTEALPPLKTSDEPIVRQTFHGAVAKGAARREAEREKRLKRR